MAEKEERDGAIRVPTNFLPEGVMPDLSKEKKQIEADAEQLRGLRGTVRFLQSGIDVLTETIRSFVKDHPTGRAKNGLPYLVLKNLAIVLEPNRRWETDVDEFVKRVGLQKALPFLRVSHKEIGDAIENKQLEGLSREELNAISAQREFEEKVAVVSVTGESLQNIMQSPFQVVMEDRSVKVVR